MGKKIFEKLLKIPYFFVLMYHLLFDRNLSSTSNTTENGKNIETKEEGNNFISTLLGIVLAIIALFISEILKFISSFYILRIIPLLPELIKLLGFCAYGMCYILLFFSALHFLLNFRKKLYWKSKVVSRKETEKVFIKMSEAERIKLENSLKKLEEEAEERKKAKQEEEDRLARQRYYEYEQARIDKLEREHKKFKNGESNFADYWDINK